MADRPLRVLIVDDDQLQLELMERSLRFEGFQVATSSSVFGVSNIMRSFEPDVMLIDVHIPALSGDQLLNLARRNAPDTTRFVLYSSCDEWRLRALAKDTNADGWISKSSDAAQVAKKLRDVCALLPGRPEAPTYKTEPPPHRSDVPAHWSEGTSQTPVPPRFDGPAQRTEPPPPFRADTVTRHKTDPPPRHTNRSEPPPRIKTGPLPRINRTEPPPPRHASDPPPTQVSEPSPRPTNDSPRQKTIPPPTRNKTEPPPG